MGLHNVFSEALLLYEKSRFFQKTLCVIGTFKTALQRCGPDQFDVMRYRWFFVQRYGVMGALKKASWRYEGPPAPPPFEALQNEGIFNFK